jgi:formate hydrogenlyase subunit 6/NADH:ubiquinone oxidoreductase subunit I
VTSLRTILGGMRSLLVGLGITGRHFVRRAVTLQYPHQRPDASHWGGPIELVTFPETGTHDCIACNACARICPSDCFAIEGKRPEGSRKMRATVFRLDFSTCSLCGLCIDVCPTDTLQYSRRYDDAAYRRPQTVNDLLAPFGEDPYLTGKLT